MKEARRKNPDSTRVLKTFSGKTRSTHLKPHEKKPDAHKKGASQEEGRKSAYEIVEGWSIPCHT